MSVLVFGRSGQLARALAELRPAWRFAGRAEADLAEPGAAARLIAEVRPKAVVNAAAYTAVDRAEEERALAFRVNGEAVGEIAAAAHAAGAMLLHVSTDYVFDGSGAEPWREDAPVRPLGAYGASKLEGERLARERAPRLVILRTAWVYSPWGRNFVRTMLRLAAERDALRVVGDQHGNPTSALDLARAVAAVVEKLASAPGGDPRWGVYHCAGEGDTSWAGLAEATVAGGAARGLIARAPAVTAIATEDYPTPARRPANSRLDCTRYRQTFPAPPRPWRAALDETLDRIRETDTP